MSEHSAEIRWYRNTESFAYENYDRRHSWLFDNGVEVFASSAKAFHGNVECVDPEEALVASISSCHMLTFLAIASRKKLVVDSYVDRPVGILEKNAHGRLAITRVILRPEIVFAGDARPSAEELGKMHELSHQECFIANSVCTDIRVERPGD